MKRYVSLVMVTIVGLSLTACGSSSTSERWDYIRNSPVTLEGQNSRITVNSRRNVMTLEGKMPVSKTDIAKAKERQQPMRMHGYSVDNERQRAFQKQRAMQREAAQPHRFQGYNQTKKRNNGNTGRVNVYW